MHGSLEFMANNHPNPTAAPEDKGGYLAYSLMHSRMSEQSFNCKLVHMADEHRYTKYSQASSLPISHANAIV